MSNPTPKRTTSVDLPEVLTAPSLGTLFAAWLIEQVNTAEEEAKASNMGLVVKAQLDAFRNVATQITEYHVANAIAKG